MSCKAAANGTNSAACQAIGAVTTPGAVIGTITTDQFVAGDSTPGAYTIQPGPDGIVDEATITDLFNNFIVRHNLRITRASLVRMFRSITIQGLPLTSESVQQPPIDRMLKRIGNWEMQLDQQQLDELYSLNQQIVAINTRPILPTETTTDPVDNTPASDYVLREDKGHTSLRGRVRANIEAITILRQLQAQGRQATVAEQEILAGFVGWGGAADIFDYGHRRTKNLQREGLALDKLLSDVEMIRAKASTLNSHYTPPPIIRAIWDGLRHLGFRGGRILEPAGGIGHFFGLCPPDIAEASRRVGVELDQTAADIMRQLYPSSTVYSEGFETAPVPDEFFDLVVSNVPFGDYGVHDPAYRDPALTKSIHNYFFVKAMEKVRPGGLVAFVTSRYTLDSSDSTVRDYLASQADLVGAVRLPSDTFKDTTDAEVVTDVIFLRKRVPGEAAGDTSWTQTEMSYIASACDSLQLGDRHRINTVFTNNPDQMLGGLRTTGNRWHQGDLVVTSDGRNVGQALTEAIQKMPKDVYKHTPAHCPHCGGFLSDSGACNNTNCSKNRAVPVRTIADTRPGTLIVGNGVILKQDDEGFVQAKVSTKDQSRVESLIAVREVARSVLRLNVEGAPDDVLDEARVALNEKYDEFVVKFGPLSDRKNQRAFREDPDLPFLLALENPDGTKADMFSTRTISQHAPAVEADSARAALSISLNETGVIDWDRMSELTGSSPAELQRQLEGIAYRVPGGGWSLAEEYLSGDVKTKLVEAQNAAAIDPTTYAMNVQALQKVQPSDLFPADIAANLGAGWIPPDAIQDFGRYLFETSMDAHYTSVMGEWNIVTHGSRATVPIRQTWGTARMDGVELLSLTLNNRQATIYDKIGNDRVINDAETLAARAVQERMKAGFRQWVWQDSARSRRLADLYNNRFNRITPRKFDGSHLTLPGTSADMPPLRPNQKDAIWGMLNSNNYGLWHRVGAGKTWICIGASMEMRRLGRAQKPIHICPNHLLDQYADDWKRMYPGARLLTVGGKDMSPKNKAATMNRMATGDYDGIICTHSAASSIPLQPETMSAFVKEQIRELDRSLNEQKATSRRSYNRTLDLSIKAIEKKKKRLERKLQALGDQSRKAKQVLCWEDLGIDQVFIDEAHAYKNMAWPSRLTGHSGLPQTQSKRAFDMYVKTQFTQRRCRCGRFVDDSGMCQNCLGKTEVLKGGVVLATATPVMNSLAELFTWQKFMQPDRLRELGLNNFDAWLAHFAEQVTALEMKPAGDGWRHKTRFSEFVNVPELLRAISEFADIRQEPGDVGVVIPEMVGGQATVVTSNASPELLEFVQECGRRADRLSGIDPRRDNMLKIVGDANKAGLDMRLIDPSAPDDPNSKVNQCVDRLLRTYTRTTAMQIEGVEGTHNGTQLVFLDQSTPKPGFNLYDDIRTKLIARGVPEKEIAFIHDAKTDAQRLALFQRVNAGDVRILLGSTEKMGTGVNAQRLIVAVHHLDAPWRPADIEQRDGRALRPGNLNPEVDVVRYVTERSLDAYRWQTLVRKDGFIKQVMSGDLTTRTAEDVDETVCTHAHVQAMATGDPRIVQHINAQIELARLSELRRAHQNQVFVTEQTVHNNTGHANTLTKYNEQLGVAVTAVEAAPSEFQLKLNEQEYGPKERKAAGVEFLALAQSTPKYTWTDVGTFRGFPVKINPPRVEIQVTPDVTRYVDISNSPTGTMTKMDSALKTIPVMMQRNAEQIAAYHAHSTELEQVLGTMVFEHEDRLTEVELQVQVLGSQIAEMQQASLKQRGSS